MPYVEALELQRALVEDRRQDRIPDTLLLVEHPPVFTLGRRRGAMANVIHAGDTPVVEVERGGDVTWHGPGQLVGYPIFALAEAEQDLHLVLRRLEDALINVIESCGLPAGRRPDYTGVFSGQHKLVSLGIAVKGWVTYHGFALNVDPDLQWFHRINPCGMASEVMGSLTSLGATIPDTERLKERVVSAVLEAFGRHLKC